MKYEMECLEPFKDGRIFRKSFKPGDKIVVTENQRKQMEQSAPTAWRALRGVIPKPDKHICPECGFEAKNALGLNSHIRHKHGE